MYTAITVSASNDLKRSYIIAVSSLKLDDNYSKCCIVNSIEWSKRLIYRVYCCTVDTVDLLHKFTF